MKRDMQIQPHMQVWEQPFKGKHVPTRTDWQKLTNPLNKT